LPETRKRPKFDLNPGSSEDTGLVLNAFPDRIPEGGNLNRKVYGNPHVAPRRKGSSRGIGLIAKRLSHLQDPLFRQRADPSAIVESPVYGSRGNPECFGNVFDLGRLLHRTVAGTSEAIIKPDERSGD
jgi:hypothetical protein